MQESMNMKDYQQLEHRVETIRLTSPAKAHMKEDSVQQPERII